jgi:hypothetical protein
MSFSEMLDESNKTSWQIHENPIVRKTPKNVTWRCRLAAFAEQADDPRASKRPVARTAIYTEGVVPEKRDFR